MVLNNCMEIMIELKDSIKEYNIKDKYDFLEQLGIIEKVVENIYEGEG